MTEKQYDVIYEKEPRGQIVTDDGIPCTARTCCTRLNRLTEENKELQEQVQEQERRKWACLKEAHRLDLENEQLKEENKELKSLCKVLIKHIEKNSIAFVIDEEVRRLLE